MSNFPLPTSPSYVSGAAPVVPPAISPFPLPGQNTTYVVTNPTQAPSYVVTPSSQYVTSPQYVTVPRVSQYVTAPQVPQYVTSQYVSSPSILPTSSPQVVTLPRSPLPTSSTQVVTLPRSPLPTSSTQVVTLPRSPLPTSSPQVVTVSNPIVLPPAPIRITPVVYAPQRPSSPPLYLPEVSSSSNYRPPQPVQASSSFSGNVENVNISELPRSRVIPVTPQLSAPEYPVSPISAGSSTSTSSSSSTGAVRRVTESTTTTDYYPPTTSRTLAHLPGTKFVPIPTTYRPRPPVVEQPIVSTPVQAPARSWIDSTPFWQRERDAKWAAESSSSVPVRPTVAPRAASPVRAAVQAPVYRAVSPVRAPMRGPAPPQAATFNGQLSEEEAFNRALQDSMISSGVPTNPAYYGEGEDEELASAIQQSLDSAERLRGSLQEQEQHIATQYENIDRINAAREKFADTQSILYDQDQAYNEAVRRDEEARDLEQIAAMELAEAEAKSMEDARIAEEQRQQFEAAAAEAERVRLDQEAARRALVPVRGTVTLRPVTRPTIIQFVLPNSERLRLTIDQNEEFGNLVDYLHAELGNNEPLEFRVGNASLNPNCSIYSTVAQCGFLDRSTVYVTYA